MGDIGQLLANPVMFHALLKIVGIYIIYMALASALPAPDETIPKYHWYRFVYGFVHALAINVDKVARAVKVPGAAIEPPKP